MAKLLDAVNRFRKVEEVCSSNDTLPPVYLMDEVVQLCQESTESAQSVAEHVNRNLQHKSAVVKYKALKLTKHCCNKGCLPFQRAMQRYASSIRELIHYKGEPDAFKGDANNQRVRDLAKETIELLYAQGHHAAGGSNLQGRIQGFGSGGSGPTGSGGGGSSAPYSANTRMMAFGSNSAPPPPSSDSRTTGFMGNPTVSGGGHSRNSSLGEPVLGGRNTSSLLPPSNNNRGSFGPVGGSFGPVGGNAGSRAHAGSTGGSDGGRIPTSAATRTAAMTGMMGGEVALVDSICSSGGLRVQPSPEDLRNFVQSVSASDGLKIAELMIKKLASDQWQVVLRTLYALEAVLDQGMTQACGEVAVMFQSDPTPVYAATSSTQQQVRVQAAKCIKLLTGEDIDIGTAAGKGAGQPAAAAQAAAAPAAPVDLLGDLFSEPAAAPAATPATVPAVPAVAAVAAAPAAAQDPFALLASITPPPVTQPAASAAGLGMPGSVPAVGQLGSVVPAAAAAAPAAPAGRPPLDDLFSSLSMGPNPAQAAQPMQNKPVQPGMGGFGVPPAANGMGNMGAIPPMQQPGMMGMPGQQASWGMPPQQPGFPGQPQPQMSAMGGFQQPGLAGAPYGGAPGVGMGGMGGLGGMPGLGGGMGHAGGPGAMNGMSYGGATPMGGLGSTTGAPALGKANAGQDAAFDFVKAAFK